jgi:hypothetical protein
VNVKSLYWLPLIIFFTLPACQAGLPENAGSITETSTPAHQDAIAPTAAPTSTPTPTLTPSYTPTALPTSTDAPTPQPPTPTQTESPSPTLTSTPEPSATIEPTPTRGAPLAAISMQANCRYGPGTAYLYSHGLYSGDQALVHGRSPYNSWLWIKPANLDRHCWASPSVMEISGDLALVSYVQHVLPKTTFYWPPTNVKTVRNGEKVTVSWDRINMTQDKDRGYLIEATVCQNGFLVWMAVRTDNVFYEFTDQGGCSGSSSGLLYTAEKHGYTDPVVLQWP